MNRATLLALTTSSLVIGVQIIALFSTVGIAAIARRWRYRTSFEETTRVLTDAALSEENDPFSLNESGEYVLVWSFRL